jgi:hypothetical protein
MARIVVVEQFCSWSACRMSSTSMARSSTGSGSYLSSVVFHIMLRKLPANDQVVVRVGVLHPDGVAVGEGRERGELRDQPDDLLLTSLRVLDALRLGVEGRQAADRRHEDPHRVRVVVEAVDELLDVLVDERVVGDVEHPRVVLLLGRQLAVDQQVGDLEEARVLGQLLDGVPAVAQDPGVTVDEGDLRADVGRVLERRVVGEQAEVVVAHLDLAQVHRADGTVLDRELVGLPGAVVGDGERVLLITHRGGTPRRCARRGGGDRLASTREAARAVAHVPGRGGTNLAGLRSRRCGRPPVVVVGRTWVRTPHRLWSPSPSRTRRRAAERTSASSSVTTSAKCSRMPCRWVGADRLMTV